MTLVMKSTREPRHCIQSLNPSFAPLTFPNKLLLPRRALFYAVLALCLTRLATAQQTSNQPQFRAPWRGQAPIAQGNNGSYSHNVCGQRNIDRKRCLNKCSLSRCNWENTYALDIGIRYAEVLAPADGVVSFVNLTLDAKLLSGRFLVLTHTGPNGDRFHTAYLHLREILVPNGVPVIQGQPIAISGASTGLSDPGPNDKLNPEDMPPTFISTSGQKQNALLPVYQSAPPPPIRLRSRTSI